MELDGIEVAESVSYVDCHACCLTVLISVQDLSFAWGSTSGYNNKQWITASQPPAEAAPGDSAAPAKKLVLDWVHGYRAYDTRSTAGYTAAGHVAYVAATFGVIYDKSAHTQQHMRAHQGEVVCFALSPDGNLAATGEIGHLPKICVWDTVTMEVKYSFRGFHRNAVRALAFSEDGLHLVSLGQDNSHSCAVYKLEGVGSLVATAKTSQSTMYAVAMQGDKIAVGGKRYMGFTTLGAMQEQGFKRAMGNGCSRMTFLCAQHVGDTVVAGTSRGVVVQFKEGVPMNILEAHEGPVNSMCLSEAGFITGGKDGTVAMWNTELAGMVRYDMNDVEVVPNSWENRRVRSVCQKAHFSCPNNTKCCCNDVC